MKWRGALTSRAVAQVCLAKHRAQMAKARDEKPTALLLGHVITERYLLIRRVISKLSQEVEIEWLRLPLGVWSRSERGIDVTGLATSSAVTRLDREAPMTNPIERR